MISPATMDKMFDGEVFLYGNGRAIVDNKLYGAGGYIIANKKISKIIPSFSTTPCTISHKINLNKYKKINKIS